MFFLYFSLWIIFFTRVTNEIAAVGAVISIAVYWFVCKHMRYKPAADLKLLLNLLRGLQYIGALIWETGKANAAIFRIVFSRTINVDPCLVYFRTKLKTNIARVVLANSITLPPGTVTVALNDDLFCVHCMNKKSGDGIENSALAQQLLKFEGQ